MTLCCPECKSDNLHKFGFKWHKGNYGARRKVPQYQCGRCGRITIHPIKK
jgi:hypothetical protein